MSVSGKTVYRVRQLVAHDIAIISEVKNGEAHGGKVRETRDSRIALGGTDSFWLVGGEKKEQKLLVQKDDASVPAFAPAISTVASRIRASSVFELPKTVNDNTGPGKFEAVSFTTAARLNVGYSSQDGDSEELISALSEGTLRIPLETAISAIEVRPGHWLTSGFEPLPAGRYRLRQQSLRSVATAALENRPDTIKLGNGLVVFVSPPKWSEPKSTDLRSEEEIHQSVERWLSRSKAALKLPGGAGSLEPAELLRLLAERAISDEEKADLASIAGHLSKRSELADILPEILGRDPAFRGRLAGFEEAEKERLRTELEERLRRETEVESARLASLRIEVADVETKLATFSHREALLRSETEKHEETLRNRIASAAEGIRSESSRETAAIRDEVARLRDDMTQIATAIPAVPAPVAPVPVVAEQAEEAIPAVPQPLASDEQRQKTLNDLAVATGLTHTEVAAIVATATDVVPVLLGPDSAAAAVDIATAFAGDDAAIIFCDPTKISLTDLLNDEHSGLRAAIDKAKERPEALFAAALCSITSGPCEYWLPQMIEMRRVGRLPRNLALVASAGVDGLRVPIPDSTLRHLFPLKPSKTPRPGSAKFEGFWPMTNLDPERVREAVGILVDRDLERSAMQTVARALARTPSWTKVSDAIDVFLRQAKWLAATTAGDEHEYDEYFINTEG
ncbi:hypothetical protein QC756_13120 [Sinorhizobium meliloti]|uniref:hypothetical protein n=1 Tax=Rhizobium meliloti TaxID=382 RepID=UPI00244DEE76|nr:hypothetical protein [Sinorhizobium meliloti]WGI73306.1 hypothetical protein QC756_13120 [Sinorhizobium meliloti]